MTLQPQNLSLFDDLPPAPVRVVQVRKHDRRVRGEAKPPVESAPTVETVAQPADPARETAQKATPCPAEPPAPVSAATDTADALPGSPRTRRGTTRAPNTNSAAALKRLAGGRLNRAQREVLGILCIWEPCTDDDLCDDLHKIGFGRNTARPRRVELERAGFVEFAGDTQEVGGSALWRLTDAGREALKGNGA